MMRLGFSLVAGLLIATAGVVWWGGPAEPAAPAEIPVQDPARGLPAGAGSAPARDAAPGLQPAASESAASPPNEAPAGSSPGPSTFASDDPDTVVELAARPDFIPGASLGALEPDPSDTPDDGVPAPAPDPARSADWVQRLLALYEVVRE